MIYFAWITEDESFGPSHERQDEDVFSLQIVHNEGDAARATVDIRNPHIGLLNAGRKQWCFISWDDGSTGGATLIFKGRIVGSPDQLQGDLVTLQFLAMSSDFATQKAALAAAIRQDGQYDPLWISEDKRDDPDAVLEHRSELYHTDRVTHAVTTSDIVEGEDGTVSVTAGDAFYDSVTQSFSQTPVRTVKVDASVFYNQTASGTLDFAAILVAASKAAGTTKPHVVTSFTGDGLINDWPEAGDNAGSGWTVNMGYGTRADGKSVTQDYETQIMTGGWSVEFPLWSIIPTLSLDYAASRQVTEKIAFTMSANCQAIVVDQGNADPDQISVSSSDATALIDPADTENPDGTMPIGNPGRRSYFITDRGHRSVEYLMCLARARLLSRARAVTVGWEMPFAMGIGLSCRKSATLTDDRLPGGTATGKIISYSLSIDGDTGEAKCAVTIGCTIGTGETVAAVEGTPTYVETGYVDSGYQVYTGKVIEAVAAEVTYNDYVDTPLGDDGINLLNFTAADALVSCTVINGQSVQKAVINQYAGDSVANAITALNDAFTEIKLDLVPLQRGQFENDFDLTVSDLQIPKTIDLEAASV